MARSFEVETGPKQECREILCELTKNYIGTPKKIFTLPGREILCVKTFRRDFPNANIVAVERIAEDFEAICEKGVNCVLGDVRSFVESQTLLTQHIDIAFLDYFSYLNKEIIADLATFLKNRNIVHRGKPLVFGLTLMKAMRGSKEETLEFMKDYIDHGHRAAVTNTLESVESSLMAFLSDTFPSAAEIVAEHSKEYVTECSMYFFCFRITL